MNCKKCKWANVSSGDTVLLMDNGMVISQHGKNNVMCLCTIPKTTNIDMTKDCCQWIKITMVIVTILHKMLKL